MLLGLAQGKCSGPDLLCRQVVRVESHKLTRYPDLTSESHVPHYKRRQSSPNVMPGNYTHSPGQHFGMIHCTCQVVRVESHKYPDLTSEPLACTTLAYMYMPAMYIHLHIATDIPVLQLVIYRCAWTSHSNVIVTRTELAISLTFN